MTGRATHGHTAGPVGSKRTTPEFRSWIAMRQRCYYPHHAKFPRYGGRGITVCARWKDSFKNFLIDMGRRPPGTTLDRRDNDGPYNAANCRWATPAEQMANRTRASFDSRSHRTRCRHGHKYTQTNTRLTTKGHRKCRACERRHAADARARKVCRT